MRCLIITPSYLPTLNGMSYATQAHASAMVQLGYESHVMCPARGVISSKNVSVTECNGILLHRVNVGGSGLLWNPISGDMQAVERHIQGLNPDVVIAEGWYSWGSYLLGRMEKGSMKFLIFSHGSSPVTSSVSPVNIVKALGYFLYEQSIQRKILKNVDGALVLSEHKDKRRFADWKLFKRFSIPTVVCANTSIFSQENSRPRKLVQPYVLTNIGEMSKNKNQLLAVEVAKKLSKKLPVRLQFVYPTENSYSREVRRKVASLRMDNAVSYVVGCDRESLRDTINGSTIILVVSSTEAQPLVVIDGLVLGIPFVSTDVGCLRSMSGGVIGAPNELHEKIRCMISDPSAYSKFSLDALNYYKESCAPSVLRKSIKKMLDAI